MGYISLQSAAGQDIVCTVAARAAVAGLWSASSDFTTVVTRTQGGCTVTSCKCTLQNKMYAEKKNGCAGATQRALSVDHSSFYFIVCRCVTWQWTACGAQIIVMASPFLHNLWLLLHGFLPWTQSFFSTFNAINECAVRCITFGFP